jgi:two-component system, NarL family, nitrate/nitrite response regulator NarL
MHPANPPTDPAHLHTGTSRAVRVVLADDEGMFRASLRQLLTAPPSVIRDVYGVDVGAGFDVVGEASSGQDTISVVQSVRPDILLLDIAMPRMSGLSALRGLNASAANVRTILLAGDITRANLLAAIQLQVAGFVRKDETTELLFEAIMCVMAGEYWVGQSLMSDLMELIRTGGRPGAVAESDPFGLTPREREVLVLVAAGYANKDIARTCAVSEETVKHHLTRMFDKVGAANRLELARVATQAGLVGEP